MSLISFFLFVLFNQRLQGTGRGFNGYTALAWAVLSGYQDIAALLLNAGASPHDFLSTSLYSDFSVKPTYSMLTYVCFQGDVEMVRIVLACTGIDVDYEDRVRFTSCSSTTMHQS